jgi:molybdopterin/thiamine biosynthesis adenylyltransferase
MIELVIDGERFARLHDHLFQDDHDEHAAVVLAGVHRRGDDIRLLARELHLVTAGSFPPGTHGYRETDAATVARLASEAADEDLSYVALHSHPGAGTRVTLSAPDRDAHERLFPHLFDLTESPVTGIAMGEESAAGEAWLSRSDVRRLDRVSVLDAHLRELTAEPQRISAAVGERHDRQARMFGDVGQRRLRKAHVAVIGAGGGGSILVEQLAHLGVGTLTVVDYDVVGPENLSRIVGATADDARKRRKKVDVLAQLVARIDPGCRYIGIDGNLNDLAVAEQVLDCDFIFLATDTISSRLVFNAIVHRYLIPGVQIGAKIEIGAGKQIEEIYVASRPVWPHTGCLQCNSLIPAHVVQREQRTEEEARAQNYVGDTDVIDPSVITLNAIAASLAATAFLLTTTGLADDELLRHRLYFPARGETLDVAPRRLKTCTFCGETGSSMFARGGDPNQLPVRRRVAAKGPSRRWRLRLPRFFKRHTRSTQPPKGVP